MVTNFGVLPSDILVCVGVGPADFSDTDGGQPQPPNAVYSNQPTLLFPLVCGRMGVVREIFLDADGGQPLPTDTV